MSRLALAALMLLAAVDARSQSPAKPAAPAAKPAAPAASARPVDDRVVQVCEIRYQDVQSVSLVLPSLMSDAGVLTVDRATRTVTVVDRPEFVQRVKEFIAQFDVPPHAVLVRIVLEKAQRHEPASAATDDLGLAREAAGWRYSPLAETTLEVLERGQATQVVGPDGAFEIHVALGSVDIERRIMRFDEIAVNRLDEPAAASQVGPPAAPAKREMFKTALDLQDRVGKVVMATRDETSDVALVVRVLGLIREDEPAAAATERP